MADKPPEKPVDLTQDEIKAREQAAADAVLQTNTAPAPKSSPTTRPAPSQE